MARSLEINKIALQHHYLQNASYERSELGAMRVLTSKSKQELMDQLGAEVNMCRRCRLWKHAKKPVPGEGCVDASLMFVGEAPGYREDVEGCPFVGAAGKILDELLSNIGLKREEVYIGNIVKHRPPANRDPREDEVAACTPYLDRQILIIEPKTIVTLGRHSTRYILSKMNAEFKGITEVRGRVFSGDLLGLPVRVVPTFHPAAALYNPKYRSSIEKDFRTVRTVLERLTSSQ